MDQGAEKPLMFNQTPNANILNHRSQTARDKLRGREGNSPDHLLRSLNSSLVGKEVESLRQPRGRLRSSHPLKKGS